MSLGIEINDPRRFRNLLEPIQNRLDSKRLLFNSKNTAIYGSLLTDNLDPHLKKVLKFTESDLKKGQLIYVYQIEGDSYFILNYLGNKEFEYRGYRFLKRKYWPIKSHKDIPFCLYSNHTYLPSFRIAIDLDNYKIKPDFKFREVSTLWGIHKI